MPKEWTFIEKRGSRFEYLGDWEVDFGRAGGMEV